MKITVIYVDNTDAYISTMCGGKSNGSPRRVTINLTPEQEKLLTKKREDETVGMMFF